MSNLKEIITSLRAETREESISPDSLGAILQRIVEEIEQTASISPLKRLAIVDSVENLPRFPNDEEKATLYLIDGSLYAFTSELRWENVGSIKGDTGPQGTPGNPGTYIDPANFEVFSKVVDLDNKTDVQRQSMLPNGKAIEDIKTDIRHRAWNLSLPSTQSDVGGFASISGANIDYTTGEITTPVGNYVIAYSNKKMPKGTVVRLYGYTTAARRVTCGYMATDPATLNSLTGQVVGVFGTVSIKGLFNEYFTLPEDAWMLMAYNTDNWSYRNWHFFLPDSMRRTVGEIGGFDLLKDFGAYLPRYSRRVILAADGSTSDTYGTSGVYYMTPEYIDVSQIPCLDYRLTFANTKSVALLAAYDDNKQYISENSIIATASSTMTGTWVKGQNTRFIRFTICTTKSDVYAKIPSAIDAKIEETVVPMVETVSKADAFFSNMDFFANNLSEYNREAKKYIRAEDGSLVSNYGASGRFYVSGYIDVTAYGKLNYSIAAYCQENLAGLAAYDDNKQYLPENSILLTLNHSATRETGTWERGENTKYIRLTLDTFYANQYVTVNGTHKEITDKLEQLTTTPPVIQYNEEAEAFLTQMRYRGDPANGQSVNNTTVLIHFSDIHGVQKNLRSILAFHDYYLSFIDDIVNTGDSVANSYPNDMAHRGVDGAKKILKTQETDPDSGETITVDNWNVIQPVGTWSEGTPSAGDSSTAEDNGYCFYYKDYPSGVRLIVLDYMAEGNETEEVVVDGETVTRYKPTAQCHWLKEVLQDARTNDKVVVIASHIVIGNINCFPCGLSQSQSTAGHGVLYNNNSFLLLQDEVQRFIEDGGQFVCWLAGHTHADAIGTLADYPSQIVAKVACAAYGQTQQSVSRISSGYSYDDFNIVCIDPTNHLLQLAKVGSRYNRNPSYSPQEIGALPATSDITNIVKISQSDYDALTEKSPTTLYIIIE